VAPSTASVEGVNGAQPGRHPQAKTLEGATQQVENRIEDDDDDEDE